MADKRVTVPIQVSIRRDSLSKYEEQAGSMPLTDMLSAMSASFLDEQVAGGLFVKAEQLRDIEQFTGAPIESAQDLVSMAKGAAGIEDGKNIFKIAIDPTYLPSLEEISRVADPPITVSDLMSQAVNQGIENQWAYGITVEGTRRIFLTQQEEQLAAILGKNFTVSDIVNYVVNNGKPKQSKSKLELVEA